MTCAFRDFDYGIDVTLREITQREHRYVESGFSLDIQAKSSINVIFDEYDLKHDLPVKNYDDLRDPNVGTPRILVLLVLPVSENECMHFSIEDLMIRRCAYWASLRNGASMPNAATVRISLPRSHAFHPEALHGIMEKIRAGHDL